MFFTVYVIVSCFLLWLVNSLIVSVFTYIFVCAINLKDTRARSVSYPTGTTRSLYAFWDELSYAIILVPIF